MADHIERGRINLGCGRRWVEGWSNLDGGNWIKRFTLRATKWLRSVPLAERLLPIRLRHAPRDVVVWDLHRTPLPFATGSADVIFSQYALEYLTTDATRRLLRDCRRILVAGGLIRLCQSDIAGGVRRYLARSDVGPTPAALERARDFKESLAGEHTKLSVRLLHGGGHQQLFDAESLTWLLTEAGFVDIRFVGMHEGDCPSLERLEANFEPVPMIRVEARVPEAV